MVLAKTHESLLEHWVAYLISCIYFELHWWNCDKMLTSLTFLKNTTWMSISYGIIRIHRGVLCWLLIFICFVHLAVCFLSIFFTRSFFYMKLPDYDILLLVCCVTFDNKRRLKMPPKFRREGSSSQGPERVRYKDT